MNIEVDQRRCNRTATAALTQHAKDQFPVFRNGQCLVETIVVLYGLGSEHHTGGTRVGCCQEGRLIPCVVAADQAGAELRFGDLSVRCIDDFECRPGKVNLIAVLLKKAKQC